jgi:DNA-binding response OmpR family regulator
MAGVNNIKVLLLEDEAVLAEIVCENLQAKGFDVLLADSIAMAKTTYASFTPDILVVDVMLPDGNGFDFASLVRKKNLHIPIIFLTSRSKVEDVVHGFEVGGNDYLKKPFSMAELVVRMNALLSVKRLSTPLTKSAIASYEIQLGKFHFMYPSGILSLAHSKRTLSSREADILHLLVQNKNHIIERKEILLQLWGNDDYFSGRSLDVFISKLRNYLKADSSLAIINVRSRGYRLVC